MIRTFLAGIDSQSMLVLRNLHSRWVRTLLTTLGIVVGVAAMVAVNATNSSTLGSINRFFDEAAGKADLLVVSSFSGEQFSEEILQLVRRMPEIEAVAPGVVGVTVPAHQLGQWERNFGAGGTIRPGTDFWLLGRDPEADQSLHELTLVAGRLLLPGETRYSLVLTEEYAADQGVEIGEDFSIVTPEQGVVSLRLVGLIAKEGIGISNEGVIGLAPLEVVQDLFGMGGQLGQLELIANEAVAGSAAELEQLRLVIQERIGSELRVQYPATRGQLVAESLESYQRGLDFFSVVSLFVGSFLIYNAFAMTVVERTREIGMLRAIGATRAQVMRLVLGEATLLGVVGSVAGVGAGLLLARGLVISVSRFSGQTIEQVSATPETMMQAVIVGVAVTLIAALFPAWQASRISPMQALRVQGTVDETRWFVVGLKFGPLTLLVAWLIFYHVPIRSDIVFQVGSNTIFLMMLGATLCIPLIAAPIERVVRPLIILVFGNEGRLGSGNVNRARGRTTLTVAALMVGISMVVGISGLTSSFESDIQSWVDTALGGDLLVRSPLRMNLEVESRLLALEEVAAVTRSRYVGTRLLFESGEDENAVFVAIDPATYMRVSGLRVQEGPEPAEVMRQLSGGDAVIVGADVANQFGIEIGHQVMLETKRGLRPFEVVAIVIDFSGGETTTVTGVWRDLRRYFGINDVSTYFVRMQPGTSLEVIRSRIEDDAGRGQSLSVESKQEFEQKVKDLSAQAFGLFDVLGLIGLVVATLGVINTMLMNVMERTRELGGLRSLGMERRQVRRMILAEAATMGFIGAVFGVAFGAILADVFVLGLESIGGFVLTSRVPYQAMFSSFFATFLVALLAAWYPARKASRVNIISAIKHE